MQILVGWDNVAEAETIGLLLNVGDGRAHVVTDAEAFLQAATASCWDAILMALSFPDPARSFALFTQVRDLRPDTPIVGVGPQGDIVRVAPFITHGLHDFVARDPQGEFIMLLPSVMEAAQAAVQAQRSRILAERLREEIESVRDLQKSVIPHEIPVPPGYEIVARYEPSEIRVLGGQPVVLAGGDYYDLYRLDHDHVILLMGDAAGHGIKACLSIMSMRTLIRMIVDRSYADTAQFVAEVNRRLIDRAIVSEEGGFITLLYCVLDLASHTLQWTSAGHPMPLLQDLATGEIRTLAGSDMAGMPLGIDSDQTYYTICSPIPAHSRLLLYSDGLADAHLTVGQRWQAFGEAGIRTTMRAMACEPLAETLERLFADSNAFTDGTGRHDDTSVVLVERRRFASGAF